jgi:preprotein translocase subunit SecE
MTNPILKIREFLTEVVVELKKSAWPTRRELVDSTIVVLVTVVLLGVFVSVADLVFVQFIKFLTKSA